MVAFQRVKDRESLGFGLSDVSNSFGRCHRGVVLTADKSVELRQVHTHANSIGIFLGCHHNWCTPFGGFSNRRYNVLADEEVELLLEFFLICEGDGTWCSHAKWSSVGRQRDFKFLPRHCTNLAIEDGWEFQHELITCRASNFMIYISVLLVCYFSIFTPISVIPPSDTHTHFKKKISEQMMR